MTTIDRADVDGSSIDVLDPQLYQGDPHPTYEWLRDHDPVHWDEKNQLWVVSRFDDVVKVSVNDAIFCSGKGIRPDPSVDLSLIGYDGEKHQAQRRLINKGFTPKAVRALEDHVRALADAAIDEVAARGECDFVTDIAVAVPITVIAELMGLPVEDRERFWRWSDDMMAGGSAGEGPEFDDVRQKATDAWVAYTTYVSAMIDERSALYRRHKRDESQGLRTEPLPDDLVMKLVAAAEEGELVEGGLESQRDELLNFLVLVVVAGNETTRNAMSGGMVAFSENPDQWSRVVADPSLWDTATEEVIRWVSPVMNFVRTATRDNDLLGVDIDEGERVLMLYQSANRDPRHFDRADEFLVDRDPNDHLAFGIGAHFCLGANLARLEVKVVFQQIAERLPDMRMAPGAGVRYANTNFVRGVESLPVVFTPES
jgi:cholest-4-en-3-one 26-monooxygenase